MAFRRWGVGWCPVEHRFLRFARQLTIRASDKVIRFLGRIEKVA